MAERDAEGGGWHLFEVTGIELEYMIVDRASLSVRPIADEVLKEVVGRYEMSAEFGPVAWSNELALHVIEIKTNGPTDDVAAIVPLFQEHVSRINALLEPRNAVLLPGAMHPLMDPHRELRLWPHEDSPIYRAFDRIFDCKGHGWANLQSTHINFPFDGDEEFGRLHAATRVLMPLLPALAASSPAADGRLTGQLDTRLDVYRHNADRIPSVAGVVVPERAYTTADYERIILEPIYRDLAPHDPEGILRYEWANARGAIAHFERGSIEIRVLDIQECPLADCAIVAAITAVLKALVDGSLMDPAAQRSFEETRLAAVLFDVARDGDHARIADGAYLRSFGFPESEASAGDVWRFLIERTLAADPAYASLWRAPLMHILDRGCLARRIRNALGTSPSRDDFTRVYARLVDCLARGEVFGADA